MSTPYIACAALLVVGAATGSLPLIAGFRALPKWIRRGQFLIGIMFIAAGILGFALYSAGTRVDSRLHQFLFLLIVLLVGMGLGVILLLGVSGEYFKALRDIDAARRERLAEAAGRHASENM